MWCSDLFNELLPLCSGCQSPFDMRCCSPQVLPCSHTLCLACVTSDNKVRKSGKRRCLTCDKRYTSFHLNTALGETIERIRVRREALESQSRRCDECEKRAYLSWMRRCITCEIQLKEAQLTSVVCMECCVDRHNGHVLRVVTNDSYNQEKVGHSISVCGSTTSSTNQYRSTLSGHSSLASPSNSRLHSTSSGSSGFSSGGLGSSPAVNSNPVDVRNGIGQKVSSFLSRVTARSGSVPPNQSGPSQSSSTTSTRPALHSSVQSADHKRSTSSQPAPPSMGTLPIAPSPSRGRLVGGTVTGLRPAMGTLSPYMAPMRRGPINLKKSLDELSDFLPKGDILREETSPFYQGQSLYGISLLPGGGSPSARSSPSASPLPPPLSVTPPPPPQTTMVMTERAMEGGYNRDGAAGRMARLSLTEGDYHRLSPCVARKSSLVPSSHKGSAMIAPSPLANMPRRDPRIRGGPAHLQEFMSMPQYENQRDSMQSTGSSSIGDTVDRITVERRRERVEEERQRNLFFDKHQIREKQVRFGAAAAAAAAVSRDSAPSHYINMTRSCENLPSQFSKLDLNNNSGEDTVVRRVHHQLRRGMREGGGGGGGRIPLRSALFNNLSDHCCSYEYIGS